MNNENEVIFWVSIIGDSGVGKTCLLKKIIDEKFDFNKNIPKGTVCLDFQIYKTSKNGKRILIQFVDTAGAEKYNSMNWANLKKVCAFLIVFDITDEVSFDNVIYWKDQIKEHVNINDVDLILVANKCDLEEKRKVDSKRIVNFEKRNDFGTHYMFFETSAKTGKGINECIEGLIEKITFRYENLIDKNTINQNIKLKKKDIVNKNNNSFCSNVINKIKNLFK